MTRLELLGGDGFDGRSAMKGFQLRMPTKTGSFSSWRELVGLERVQQASGENRLASSRWRISSDYLRWEWRPPVT